ncbi:MAG TPA: DUF362 domain-containing protein [Planctomycetaceae bacterium]|nr:DUF362 domain-containing protein [Planctomycetaceae bacterium]
MAIQLSRRRWLASSLGAAGVLATGRLAGAAATPAGELRDRSGQAPAAPVALVRCPSFDPQRFCQRLDEAFDLIGGIRKLVSNQTVTIKTNMTGLAWKPCCGLPAQETYQTHPNTVAALCAALRDAGARRIVVVENYYWDKPAEQILAEAGWDIGAIQSAGGHRVLFEDTRNRGGWPGYSRFQVPWGGFVYPAFDLNQRFEKTDVLISLAKLKQHACAGITGAVKNFFGITPCSLYGNTAPTENPLTHRTAMFHSGRKTPPAGVPGEVDRPTPTDARYRVPRIVADIYGARPADLAIVEGVRSISGGEGHWNRGVALVEPKVLLVGRNGVCVDTAATAVMGFDPQAPPDHFPFQGDNHLQLLASVGVGTNDLDRIEIIGLPLKEAVYPYAPQRPGSG